jgi:hypothetical protein
MLVRSSGSKQSGSWQLVMYETDAQGRCSPELRPSDMDAEIAGYYEQRVKELERLQARLFAGELSPIGFFIELQRMTPEDVAPRMRLRASVVRKHARPEGFEDVSIAMLRRYARLFDVSVGDFFQFVELTGELVATVRSAQGGLVQHVRVTSEPGEGQP